MSFSEMSDEERDEFCRELNRKSYEWSLSEMEPVTDETLPDWEKYICQQGVDYEWEGTRGYTSLDVLQFLWGKPISRLAMGYIHSLRPSSIRVVKCWETSDAQCWRVTIRLEEDGKTIRNISQEVEIAGGAGAKLAQAYRQSLTPQ